MIKTKFKTNIVHKADATPKGVYYACIHAIGDLSTEQLIQKTNWRGKKITCKNCRKRYLYKQTW
jgi:hypothetical protein